MAGYHNVPLVGVDKDAMASQFGFTVGYCNVPLFVSDEGE